MYISAFNEECKYNCSKQIPVCINAYFVKVFHWQTDHFCAQHTLLLSVFNILMHWHGLNADEREFIRAVFDMYAAMTNDRPYRKALTDEVVIAELQKISGSQLDPGLVKIFPVSFKDKV